MTVDHGPVKQISIADLSEYLKLLIPRKIPANLKLKPQFHELSNESDLREGIVAYRDFLYLFCDYLRTDGHSYFKVKKNPKNHTDYPFLFTMADLLFDIGYHSTWSQRKDSLFITKLPLFTPTMTKNGRKKSPKNSKTKLFKCLRFLSLCGFHFTGIDLDSKEFDFENELSIDIKYPKSPKMLLGLKVLSIADTELREKRYKNDYRHDNLFRCEFRLIEKSDQEIFNSLNDFLSPLPESIQKIAIDLHHHTIELGLTCVSVVSTFEIHFAYTYLKKTQKKLTKREVYQKRLLSFNLSMRNGFSLLIRPEKIEKYPDITQMLSPRIQNKIKRGYGCDRKLYNKPCQRGCEGIRFSLDTFTRPMNNDIKIWIDQEVLSIKK